MTRASATGVPPLADPAAPEREALAATVSTLAPAAERLRRSSLRRLRGPAAAELARFLSIGVLCTLVDLAVAFALRFGVGVGPTTAKTAAVLVATGVSYLGNRLWTFGDRVDPAKGHRRDVLVFCVLNGIGLVITLVPVTVAHYALGLTGPTAFTVSSVLGNLAATSFRYWAYRRYVFSGPTT